MTGIVRTARGDIDGDELGRTDYHEHLLQVSPLLLGDELDDEERSRSEAAMLNSSGFDAMIDATPTGLGRDPLAVARISAATGLHVVLTTGAHREQHYAEDHWVRTRTEAQLAVAFQADVEVAFREQDASESAPLAVFDGNPVRAGVIKAGIGYWSISAFEQRVLHAVAAAHRATNAPVMVHLEHGTAAFEVVELLGAAGVPAEAVVLAHIDRNPDPVLHADLAGLGCYLGYDTFARARDWPDSVLIDCAVRAVDGGAGRRILIGGDVARRTRYRAYGGMPGLGYLGRRVLPRLADALGGEAFEAILVGNPARFLGRF